MSKTTTTDRVGRLRAIPLFAGLSDDSLGAIAEAMTEFEASPGQVLIQQDRPGSGLFIVQDGALVVERPGKNSIELGPGEFVGELALLTPEGIHTARVRAKTPAVLLAVSRADFGRLIESEPSLAVAMLSGLAARLARMMQNT